jgi:hypothetical protein
MAVIILLAVAIFLIISRHRQRKCFASPLAAKTGLPPGAHPLSSGSSCGTAEKCGTGTSYKGPADQALLMDVKLDDYQEPYQALKYAPYYSYSTVVMEMRDTLNKTAAPLPSGKLKLPFIPAPENKNRGFTRLGTKKNTIDELNIYFDRSCHNLELQLTDSRNIY